jgi:DNA-directed RNA polymerase II subunit RPB2
MSHIPAYFDSKNPHIIDHDMSALLIAEVMQRGLCSDHINSMNDLIDRGFNQIMTKTFMIEKTIRNDRAKTEEDKTISYIQVRALVSNVTMRPPTTTQYASSKEILLSPKNAHMSNKTYSFTMYADFEIIATAQLHAGGVLERKAKINNVLVSSIPCMVGSKLCNSHNKTYETLQKLQEDPTDKGGYFCIQGNGWCINSSESTTNNKLKVFLNAGHSNELVRLEILSKYGDGYENSTELHLKLLVGNQLIVFINTVRSGLKHIQIPFFILFRLLDWSSDKKITDWITYDTSSTVSAMITEELQQAFIANYTNFGECIHMHDKETMFQVFNARAEHASGYTSLRDEKSLIHIYNNIMNEIDTSLFPHIGSTADTRNEKAMFLAHICRRLYLVKLGVVDVTDRDALGTKRAHSAGVSLAKAFKQHYNFIIVQQIKKQFNKDFRSTSFSKVDLTQSLKSAINSSDLERGLSQAITTGTKQHITIKSGGKMVNRLSSQQIHRKNQLNVLSTLRQITTPSSSNASNQSSRAKEMRKVHPTYAGFICPVQTQDGASVGLSKQLAMSASLTLGSSSILVEELINDDPDFTAVRTIEMMRMGWSNVSVNGHIIGCVERPSQFVAKYRQYRREKKIDMYTSIYLDICTNEVHFMTDAGRLTRPLIIVHNNYKDRKEVKSKRDEDFKQWINLTNDHLIQLKAGRLSVQTLIDEHIIEYISDEEQVYTLIAMNHTTLWKNRTNPLLRYTHCDIPIAMFGIIALVCMFANHSTPARAVTSSTQSKQAIGWYSLAWPYRLDKDAYMQYNCEMPMVQTVSNLLARPAGINCIVAVQLYGSYNQEDSIIMNRSAIQRGLFNCVSLSYEKAELEKNEQFVNPDIMLTADIKQYASYEKIHNGFPRKGTVLVKNDIIIGKISKYTGTGDYKFVDRSIVYKYPEPCTIVNVVVGRNQDGKPFVKVQFMVSRECEIGDKFATRAGQKGVVSNILNEEDMPFTESGIVPDIIFSPFSLPGRMTVNYIIEMLLAKLCALKGITTDGTTFSNLNIRAIQYELKALGHNSTGVEKMYNGMNGKMIECEIFIGPVFYQRLQKFSSKEITSSSQGSTDALTRQPVSGKRGGQRIGYMEKDTLVGNGLARFITEKFYNHSDGFKIYICRGCGNQATVNVAQSIYSCKRCGDLADIAEIDSSWTSQMFMHELRSMNIGVMPFLQPYEYEKRN